MTTRSTSALDTTPSSPASPPSSPGLSTSPSLPVTAVLDTENLQGPPKSSDSAMQTFQRLQTQPSAPAPALSPSRVNLSVADDLDDILSRTLEELDLSPTPAPAPAQCVEDTFLQELDSTNIEQLVMCLTGLNFNQKLSLVSEMPQKDIISIGKQTNHAIETINLFFIKFLQPQTSLQTWLERESKTLFFTTYRPFAISHSLSAILPQLTCLNPYLNQELIREWTKNYHGCVLLLKQNGLEAYNEQLQQQPMLQMVEDMLPMISENPQLLEFFRTQTKSMLSNPETLQNQMENLMKPEAFQNQIQEQYRLRLQTMLPFFQRLDEQLRQNPQEKTVIDAWLKNEASKSDYLSPFYQSKDYLNHPLLQNNMLCESSSTFFQVYKDLFEKCCQQLVALDLQHYVQESPCPKVIAQYRVELMPQKAMLNQTLSECLSTCLRPLTQELKKLPIYPEARSSNREIIENWFKKTKDADVLFFDSGTVFNRHQILKGIVDEVLLTELSELYPFCRDQLTALGLEKYMTEIHLIENPQLHVCPAAPKKEISIVERFKQESEFFRLLIQQDVKTVDQWLKENSPKFDYPLLWAKKRFSQLSHYRDSVSIDLRRVWINRYEKCVEDLNTPELRYHLNLEQIPADASPELRAFLQG